MIRKRVGDIAIEIINKENMNIIGYGEIDLLDEIYSKAKEERTRKIL